MSRGPRRSPRPGDVALEQIRAERRHAERAANKGRTPKRALLALIVGALMFSSIYPARTLVAKRAHVAALAKRSAALDRTIADLTAQRDALQTDAKVEQVAREDLGMIRPGETAFAVVPAQSPLPPPPPKVLKPAPATEEGPSGFALWWDAFTSSLKFLR